jgi:hypothetical protein
MAGNEGGRIHDREVPRLVYDDRTGARWRVREVDARAVPGARAESCLLFEGEGVIRRVWNYPRDWSHLSPEDLVSLSWRR